MKDFLSEYGRIILLSAVTAIVVNSLFRWIEYLYLIVTLANSLTQNVF